MKTDTADQKTPTTPPPRTRRLKKEEIQERLLAAAATVFAAKGFEKTTLEEVAETAGFSKGAVYSNFAGKDEIFFALMERLVEERIKSVEQAISGCTTLEDSSRIAGNLLSQMTLQKPEWQVLFIEYWLRAIRNPELQKRYINRREPLRARIAAVFEGLAQTNGLKFPLAAKSHAVAILALSNGLALEGLIDPEAVPTDLFSQLLNGMFQGTVLDAPPVTD